MLKTCVIFLTILYCLAAPSGYSAPKGMIAWYPLEGNFKDASGNGYDLKPRSNDNHFSSDSVLKKDKNICFGPILKPDGVYGAVGPELPLDNKTGFTICGFASKPQNNSYSGLLFGCGSSDHRQPGALFYVPWGVLHSKVGFTEKTAFKRFNDNQWHHHALVVPPESTGDTYDVYIDGEKAYSGKLQRLKNYGKFFIGQLEGKQCSGFKIDEVKVFNRPLSAEEIKQEATTIGLPQPKETSETGIPRRVKPQEYDFPLKGELSVHFLTDHWICIVGNYNDFIRERFKKECGTFLKMLDSGQIKVKKWSYDFHYSFGALEVIGDYRPKIKKNFENINNFTITAANGQKQTITELSYWLNAIGRMRVPIIATGKLKMIEGAAVAHFAYVKLESPLKNGQKYTITTPNQEKVSFTYDEHKNISMAIKVNQVGYKPDAGQKYAYLGAWLGPAGPLDLWPYANKKYFIIDDRTGKEVFSAPIYPRAREQYYTGSRGKSIPINGENVMQMDFSSLKTPGKYHIYIPGIGRSWSFEISDNAVAKAFYTHARGLFHQRSGIAKDQPYTNWTMGADHMASWRGGYSPHADDYKTKRKDGYGYRDENGNPLALNHFDVIAETATDEKLPDVYGGWWDAGDFDRRTFHFRIVEDLLSAYLLYPEKLPDGQLDIPESGNGIPDIIDEAAWGVDIWRRAQNEKGGVGCWLEATSHPKIHDPSKDTQKYYLALPTRKSTMMYASHAAMLALAYKKCGAQEKSDLFLKSAEKAFAYAINPANTVKHSWKHYDKQQKKDVTYSYIEPPPSSPAEEFKAALNLYLLTKKAEYKQYLTDAAFDKTLRETEYPRTPFFLTELLADEAAASFPLFNRKYKIEIMRQADKWLDYQSYQAYRNLNWPPNHRFFENLAWGNAIPFNKGRYFVAAHKISGDRKYRDAALLLNDWVCGANPMGRTLTTGLGTITPIRILSLSSYADDLLEPLPGITIYTYTSRVHYNAKNMVYALRYKPRKDHNFEGLDICLMPESVSNGANMSYDDIGRAMDKMYPIWRRFANLEGLAVEQNEFTVWETIGPSAAVLACLIPDGWKPPPEWKDRKPIQNLNEFKGYLFQP